jgi:hypothetical protein
VAHGALVSPHTHRAYLVDIPGSSDESLSVVWVRRLVCSLDAWLGWNNNAECHVPITLTPQLWLLQVCAFYMDLTLPVWFETMGISWSFMLMGGGHLFGWGFNYLSWPGSTSVS